jgi:ornithine cyclodeaminase/alanine dehydrogenase-like protein (mu-crystallin family)
MAHFVHYKDDLATKNVRNLYLSLILMLLVLPIQVQSAQAPISAEELDRLAKVAEEAGLPFEAVEREQLGSQADVIITITSAHEALLLNDWIKPGTI